MITLSLFPIDYNLTRADHSDDVREEVCMYCKENLSLRIINTSYFNQCLLCEVTCQNQKVILLLFIAHQVSHVMNLKTFCLRWLLGFRKLRSSKKSEILQVVLVLRVASWKSIIFFIEESNVAFSLFSLLNYLLLRGAIWICIQL